MNGQLKARKENVNNLLFYKVISLMVFLLSTHRLTGRSWACLQIRLDLPCLAITAQSRLQLLPPFSETQYPPGRLGAVDSNGESREIKRRLRCKEF